MSSVRQLVSLSGDHTIDADLLPESPVVLDVGARGFGFIRDILRLRPKALVVALEPDPNVQDPDIVGCEYVNKALVSDSRALRRYASFSTGEANFLCDAPSYYDAEMKMVRCITIHSLMVDLGITHWDAIKLDCEGSEFGILENWPGPIATQISVEFHDFQDRRQWNDEYFARLFSGPLRDYEVIQHELTPVGPDKTFSHWDSLLVLKS